MSDMNNSQTSKMINQIYFELYGGEQIKKTSREMNQLQQDIKSAFNSKEVKKFFKEVREEADLATASCEKTIKKWSTLAKMSPQFSNISTAMYSKQEKGRITNIARNTHSTEMYKDYYSEGSIDYSAARTAWKQQEAERKQTQRIQKRISEFLEEGARFEKQINEERAKELEAAKKINKVRQMTQNQIEKNQRAIERNRINSQNAETRRKDYERRKEVDDDNKAYRLYRSQHPELFGSDGLAYNKKHQFSRTIRGLGQGLMKNGVEGKVVGSVIDSIGAFAKSVPLGISTTVINLASAIKDLGSAAVQAYSEIEAIKVQLGVVFSNQTQADNMFGQISQYAVKSPFGVQQTSELAVLLKQSGVYATDLMDTLRMLGDTAGGNMEKMKRIANNYAQIMAIGKASMLDMRQFAYAGIPIFEAVSKELGVSQQELRKLISDGKVTSDIIEKVFKDLTGINGIFENATEKGAKTLKARLQNLSDARQLAFASIGEWGVNLGTRNGGDSIGLGLVTKFEDFYSWLREHVDTKNIERDVNTIANSDKRIQDLEAMLKYAKEIGDKEAQKVIEAALKTQRGMFNVDTQRSIYAEAYDAHNKRYNEYRERYGFMSEGDISSRKDYYKDLRREAISKLSQTSDIEEQKYLQEYINTMSHLIDEMDEYKDAIKEMKKTTEEEIKANRERTLIDAQQLAFDQANKAANVEGTYTSAFEKLYSLYTSSDEYKEQKLKEEVELLKAAKEELTNLSKSLDNNGNLDITQLSYSKFSDLYNNKKALDPSTKLQIVEGNKPLTDENRKKLMDQWSDMTHKIEEELKSKGQFDAVNRMGRASRLYDLSVTDDKQFFNNFDLYLKHQLEILKSLEESATTDKDKEYYKQMSNNLLASTFGFTVNDKGKFANPEDLLKGSTDLFVPLWKRILSSATGLSTQGMTGTLQTMQNYRDDMAIRNMTSSVLSATMKAMGIDTAMGLVKTSGNAKVLRGDTGATYQVDWQATRKAIKDFSTQLSASTAVITAYKSSLEQELDIYEQLIAAGYTEAESQDLKNQKTVSTKTLEKLSMDAGDQLVNAFGEGLKTASGKTAFFKDGEFVDEQGNKLIEEEIIMTGNLFEFIKGELPRLREEIHEATVAEENNKIISSMYSQVKGNEYISSMLANSRDPRIAGFLSANPEYLENVLKSSITKNRDEKYKNVLGNMSVEDILAKSFSGAENAKKLLSGTYETDVEREEAQKQYQEYLNSIMIVQDAFKELGTGVDELVSSGAFKNLEDKLKSLERNTEATAAVIKMQGAEFAKATKPEEELGRRGFNNWLNKNVFGDERKYDDIDLYAAAAKAGTKFSEVDNQGVTHEVDLSRFKGSALSAEEIAEQMTEVEKATIKWKEGLEDVRNLMKDLGASALNISNTFAKGTFNKSFEAFGASLLKGDEAIKDLKNNYKQLAAEMLQSVGIAMQEAGWNLVAMGAKESNKGYIAAGLALAAAGGFASGIGGVLAENDKNKNKTDKETEKLENLKSDLQKLLEQARTDALYYENNLRHQTALGTNKQFSYKSVHDAVITPKGDVVTTDPKDYLIATKTPQQFAGGNVTVQPIINCNVVNNTNAQVRQEQQMNADGSMDIITIIEEVAGGYIASSRSDEAFASRDFRISGKQAIM